MAADELDSVRHVLARTTFGPFAGRAEAELDRHGSAQALLEHQLSAAPVPFEPTQTLDGRTTPLDIDVADVPQPEGSDAEHRRITRLWGFRPWWVRRMASDAAGLHEKMMWFWHGHFTTSSEKVDDTTLCWRQLRTLHTHALGNFGDLAKTLTVDGAMLRYLDGASSVAEHPNENFARELMELFTLGFGTHRQSDVVAAAQVFAGYTVTNPDQNVVRIPENTLQRKVTVFGRTRRFTPDELIDLILEQDACAPFVVTKMWRSFVGAPDERRIAELADSFRRSGYEIAPLIAAMLRTPEFAAARRSRARTPIEWYCAAMRATGDGAPEAGRDSNLDLFRLGQSPYLPPNVAGWPDAAAWLSPTQARARALLVGQLRFPMADELGDDPAARSDDGLVDAVAARCAVGPFAPASRAPLVGLAAALRDGDRRLRAAAVLGAALLTTEMSLS